VGFSQSSGKQAFSFGKVNFQSKSNFRLSQVSEIGFKVFSQGFGKLVLGFLQGSFHKQKSQSAKSFFQQAFW
jgi:hypothetical protein